MSALQVIEMFAGLDPSGQPIAEKIQVRENEDGSCQLVRSPCFVKGVASGDTIKFLPDTREFELVKRSGNLSIRVISRADVAQLAEGLTPAIEKLGGELDAETPRMLVYSIHVSCGFKTIEKLLNDHIDMDEGMWMYGNVYDPVDGQTLLNWWQDILAEK